MFQHLHVLDIAMSKSTFLTECFMILLFFMCYCIVSYRIALCSTFSVFYIRTHIAHMHTHTHTFNKHNQNILTQQLCWQRARCIVYVCINIVSILCFIQLVSQSFSQSASRLASNSDSFINSHSHSLFLFLFRILLYYYLQFCHWDDFQFIDSD